MERAPQQLQGRLRSGRVASSNRQRRELDMRAWGEAQQRGSLQRQAWRVCDAQNLNCICSWLQCGRRRKQGWAHSQHPHIGVQCKHGGAHGEQRLD